MRISESVGGLKTTSDHVGMGINMISYGITINTVILSEPNVGAEVLVMVLVIIRSGRLNVDSMYEVQVLQLCRVEVKRYRNE